MWNQLISLGGDGNLKRKKMLSGMQLDSFWHVLFAASGEVTFIHDNDLESREYKMTKNGNSPQSAVPCDLLCNEWMSHTTERLKCQKHLGRHAPFFQPKICSQMFLGEVVFYEEEEQLS